MAAKVPSRQQDYGQPSEEMRALPNDRWRSFVECYLLEPPGHGSQVAAARKAGFGTPTTSPRDMARIAVRLLHDPRMQAAIEVEAKKFVRGGAPEAAKALLNMVQDPKHRDHARAVAMLLDRSDPIKTHAFVEVTHKVVNYDVEAIEELRAARTLGASREKLTELFGETGLMRIEALEARDSVARADKAKVIDAEYSETTPDEPVPPAEMPREDSGETFDLEDV